MKTYFHSGDLGDTIAALPVIRQLGGGKLILGNRRGMGAREPMTEARFKALKPLLELQPYITEVTYENDPVVDYDFHYFRSTTLRKGLDHTLVNWQGDYIGIPNVDISPWLTNIIPKSLDVWKLLRTASKGKVIFSRTMRYQNFQFNWSHAFDKYYPDVFFIGFETEYKALCRAMKREIPWRKTFDLLRVAELIAGSDLLISNQNVHFWIAAGMGHPLIQETDVNNMNSVIPRENAQYFSGPYPCMV